MLLLLLVELFLVLILSPHPKWEDNALMTISLVVLVVHSYSGAIYSVRPGCIECFAYIQSQLTRAFLPTSHRSPQTCQNGTGGR